MLTTGSMSAAPCCRPGLVTSTSSSVRVGRGRGLTSGPTAATDSTTTGNAVASLLLGTGSGGSAPTNVRLALTQVYYAGYVQDTWRLSQRLAVNFGVRYEIQLPRTERYNRFN